MYYTLVLGEGELMAVMSLLTGLMKIRVLSTVLALNLLGVTCIAAQDTLDPVAALAVLKSAASESVRVELVHRIDATEIRCTAKNNESASPIAVMLGGASLLIPRTPEAMSFLFHQADLAAAVTIRHNGQETTRQVDHNAKQSVADDEKGVFVLNQHIAEISGIEAISVQWSDARESKPLSSRVSDSRYTLLVMVGHIAPAEFTTIAGHDDASIVVTNSLILAGVPKEHAQRASERALVRLKLMTSLERWQEFLRADEREVDDQHDVESLAYFLYLQLERQVGGYGGMPDRCWRFPQPDGVGYALQFRSRWVLVRYGRTGDIRWQGQFAVTRDADPTQLLCIIFCQGISNTSSTTTTAKDADQGADK